MVGLRPERLIPPYFLRLTFVPMTVSVKPDREPEELPLEDTG